jgi:hypothetical protein
MFFLAQRPIHFNSATLAASMPNNIDARSVLWNPKVGRIQYAVVVLVFEIGERRLNNLECSASIVALKTRNVLKQERLVAMMSHDPDNIMKEGSLGRMLETLPFPNCAEWLAGESGQKHIELWDVAFIYLSDVSVRNLTEVGCIGLLRVLIPFGRKNTTTISLLEREPHTTDPGKEIDKTK